MSSVISTEIGYGLDDPRCESWQETRDFSVLQNAQTGFGTHPASHSMGTRIYPGAKATGT